MPQNGASRNELPTDRLWTIGEVAAYLRVSEQTVRNRMNDSGLPFEKIGAATRFRREDIDTWLDGQGKAPAADAGGTDLEAA